MGRNEGQSDWQRRYDESLARERALKHDDDTSGVEFVAMEASGCLPGILGVIAVGITSAVMMVRRRRRS